MRTVATERLVIHPDPRAVREARRLTARMCATAGLSDDVSDTAVLLTSEVVTNAVIHGRSEARITVSAGPAGVRVEVADDNSRLPVRQVEDTRALDGRGVGLLASASSSWGVREEVVGKVVWFEVAA